ncbi:hypothetical protein C1H57_00170 [Clostridium sp. 2-1]|uniref:DUF2334 domain-containing protein n=2 Tax=Clostridiaceae TaxID=31979 RepID=UPI000CDA4220|nr:DUF2334 domain-containing protein [Clostridium beijerinckii]POO93219.1 hypothetical protein C1H57_00170 [Clostridium sp. 2-1]MBN7574148.1 DUF2334 domain-containing protein [Clostridium beijerinckii]MBN7579203.1 DUF2334 domain-containing protein [Clostridium beijerinckii]MBN7583898.1 DUF2334 domain-containing protein [Clostridium beijerinckii]MBO0518955.1 DUF2334 domain-containing protein [Clostridium beijerinckii]
MIYMNKCFIYRVITILICFIGAEYFINPMKCYGENEKVLILYDKSKEYGSEKNLLSSLVKSQLSKEKEINISKINIDNPKDVEQYNEIFILNIGEENHSIEELKSYDRNIKWIKKSSELLDKKGFKLKTETYLYLDNVTPFNDLNNLIGEIDYLKDKGIKFFIEAAPVFVNEDLKAMGRFSEALRYAQANGGKVILKFPIINSKGVNGTGTGGKIIGDKLKEAFKNYTNYWIYPVGINADEEFLYREDLKNILEGTNTLFLNYNEDINIDIDNYEIKAYTNFIQKVDLNDYINNEKISGKNAIKIESNCNLEEFKNNIDKVLSKEINLIPSNKMSTYIKFESEIKNDNGRVFFNNQEVTQDRFINAEEYENAVNKTINKENPIKEDLTLTNRRLEIFSGAALIIFIGILIISRNIERKRFFK